VGIATRPQVSKRVDPSKLSTKEQDIK